MSVYAENNKPREEMSRVVVDLSVSLLREVDDWGVPAGMRSRSDAIRSLLRRGLDVESEEAAGHEFGDQKPAAESQHEVGREARYP